MSELFGHLAFILIALGMWRLGREDRKGFLYHVSGCVVLCGVGFFSEQTYLVVWNIIFAIIGIVGYRRMGRQNDA